MTDSGGRGGGAYDAAHLMADQIAACLDRANGAEPASRRAALEEASRWFERLRDLVAAAPEEGFPLTVGALFLGEPLARFAAAAAKPPECTADLTRVVQTLKRAIGRDECGARALPLRRPTA